MKPPPVQTPTPCFDENIALALIDGQLAMPQRHAALTHAEGCDACRLLLRELAAPTQDSIQPSTPPSTPPSIGVWELLEEVGRGSAGTVHRARHRDSGLLAAVKLVNDAQLRARFEREARALASLSYPGIVRYYEHGVLPNGTMFLVMQWLEGPTLEARLESGPRLNAHEVVELGVRLAYALGHAHGRGCVHRDLSPKNVILHEGKL